MRRALVAVLAVPILSECASLAPDAGAAADVASSFHRALSDGDGAAACALLAPETAAALEQDSGQSCRQAVIDQDIPDGGTALDRQAYGQTAQVLLTGDVVFLASVGDQWRVSAAGCTPRNERPYHCSIEGG